MSSGRIKAPQSTLQICFDDVNFASASRSSSATFLLLRIRGSQSMIRTPLFHACTEQSSRLIAGQRFTKPAPLIPLTRTIHIISYASQQVTRHPSPPTHSRSDPSPPRISVKCGVVSYHLLSKWRVTCVQLSPRDNRQNSRRIRRLSVRVSRELMRKSN